MPCAHEAPLPVPLVVAECQLPVRAGGDDAPAPPLRERPAREEARRPLRGRGTRSGSAASSARRPRPASRRPRRRRRAPTRRRSRRRCSRSALVAERAQRRLLALLGEPLVDGLVRALQGAVDRRRRRLERVGDLAAREAEHVAQDQHGALARRQVLERGDERELDALALLVASLGRGEAVLEAEPLVRVRLDPDRLDERLGRGRRAGRPPGRSRSAARAWAAARSPSGRRWSRSCRATSAASCGPRTGAARARRRSSASWSASSASWTEPSIR